MDIDELITQLRKQGIFISVVNSQVGVKVAQGNLPEEILTTIKERRTEILNFFQAINKVKKRETICKTEKKSYYKLAYSQTRMYFLHEFNPSSIAYNMPSVLRLSGILNKDRLAKAFNDLFTRHEIFRTYFTLIDGVPFQQILDETKLDIVNFKSDQGNWRNILEKFIRPFDLSKAPLIRVGLISLSELEQVLIIDMHHIISDGISNNILIKDFISLYNFEKLEPATLQYRDYAEWQQSDTQQDLLTGHKDFWLDEHKYSLPALELPADFPRPPEKQYTGGKYTYTLGLFNSCALKKIAEREGVTMFMLMFASFSVLLSKLSGQEDIVIGVPVSGRNYPELEEMLGLFVNTLPIRVNLKSNYTFKEYLGKIKQKTVSCFEHQNYPYEKMVEELQFQRDPGRNPLFDVMFSYQHDNQSVLTLPNMKIDYLELNEVFSKFDLRLDVKDYSEGLQLDFEYSTCIFKEETICDFSVYFNNIIQGILKDEYITLSQMDIMSNKDRYFILNKFNDTKVKFQLNKTIVDLFVEQSLKTPDQVALIFESNILTYSELNKRSSVIAHYLRQEKGLLQGDIVGVMLEREMDLLSYLLGIMKAGGTYVPIDLNYPEERIERIISNSGLKLLITRCSYSKNITVNNLIDLDVISHSHLLEKFSDKFNSIAVNTDLAYVLYTSGSTGIPKGVMIRHRSLVNYISWAVSMYECGPKTVFPVFSSISFDLTVTSIFCPLICGGSVLLYREDSNVVMVEKVIRENKATIIKLTPSHLRAINYGNWLHPGIKCGISKFVIGGEQLSTHLARTLYNQFNGNVEIYNEYGPTEATVGCMIYKFNPDDDGTSVPIGAPIANTQVYILDGALRPVAKGVCGDLYIGGEGLALGYIRQNEISSEKFIANPFIEGMRMYSTGDRAVMNKSGQLIFKGRSDNQVKIRGYRVELEEVSRTLSMYPEILEAIVLTNENTGNDELIAYYISESNLNDALMKSFLSIRIPTYMIPAYFIKIDTVPVTINGKIDKSALLSIEIPLEDNYQAAASETETKLVELWSKILDIDKTRISVNKSFFELGGTSLKLIKLVTDMNLSFPWKVSVADLFRYPSILSILKFVNKGDVKAEPYKENILNEVSGMQDLLDQL